MRAQAARWLKERAPAPVRSAAGALFRMRDVGRDPHDAWERNLRESAAWWLGFFRDNPDILRWRLDPAQEVPHDLPIRALIEAVPDETVEILDVGAGPLNPLGFTVPGKTLRIVPTDPLAEAFDDLLTELGVEPVVRTISVEGEHLHEYFDADRFHIACSFNALDHTYDPVAVIESMLKVTRPGGHVLLRHYRNEAEHELYRGLHQWNIDADDGRLIIWNHQSRQDVSQLMAHLATCDARIEDGQVIADFVKVGAAGTSAPSPPA